MCIEASKYQGEVTTVGLLIFLSPKDDDSFILEQKWHHDVPRRFCPDFELIVTCREHLEVSKVIKEHKRGLAWALVQFRQALCVWAFSDFSINNAYIALVSGKREGTKGASVLSIGRQNKMLLLRHTL
jgi:hypothetical protein